MEKNDIFERLLSLDKEQHRSNTISTRVPLPVLHNRVSREKIVSTAAAETQTSLLEPLDTSHHSLMENTDLKHSKTPCFQSIFISRSCSSSVNLKIHHNMSPVNGNFQKILNYLLTLLSCFLCSNYLKRRKSYFSTFIITSLKIPTINVCLFYS